jgi:hypothetical protein
VHVVIDFCPERGPRADAHELRILASGRDVSEQLAADGRLWFTTLCHSGEEALSLGSGARATT